MKRKINNGAKISIIINGVQFNNFSDDYLTYSQICSIANTHISYNPSITFKSSKGSDILNHDEELKPVDGMIINCTATGNA